jgi:hypothetical protein
MKLLVPVFLLTLFSVAAFAGPIFPTRSFLMQPRWDAKTDTNSIFDHASYWAQLQRGFNSDSDRWGWSVSMGAIFEFARWHGNESLFGFTGMELLADTHNDISFKPQGAMWEEGLVYAVHESDNFDWQLGMLYRCKHNIDNSDPQQYSQVDEQRTLIYCSLSGKAIWTSEKLFGMHLPTTAWLHGDAYLIREDYRLPQTDDGIGTEFNHLAWSAGEAFQTKIFEWNAHSVYLMLNTDFSAFSYNTGFLNRFGSIAQITFDDHAELGYEFHGRMGRMQLYAGWEQWQDDGQTPIPRNAQFALLGIRMTGADMVTF